MKQPGIAVLVRRALTRRLARWSARRHGADRLPMTMGRRRIYILPTRFGLAIALLLAAMLLAGLNYNSNLGLAFGFLMASLALVVMHHCHRNLLGLLLDGPVEIDVIAGEDAVFDFRLGNDTAVERCDIEIHCAVSAGSAMVGSTRVNVPAKGYCQAAVAWPVAARGVLRIERVELRTRYPIGWFRAWSYAHTALTAYVAPRPWGDRPLAAQAAAVGNAAESPMRGDEEFAGLRNYEAGVPLKHMAWKVLARGGAPAVRIYSGLAAQPQWLEWGSLEPLDVETRLAQLCRWVLACDAARRAYGLRIPGTEIAPSLGETHRAACLRALALYPVEPGA